jgi:hypothetical protein
MSLISERSGASAGVISKEEIIQALYQRASLLEGHSPSTRTPAPSADPKKNRSLRRSERLPPEVIEELTLNRRYLKSIAYRAVTAGSRTPETVFQQPGKHAGSPITRANIRFGGKVPRRGVAAHAAKGSHNCPHFIIEEISGQTSGREIGFGMLARNGKGGDIMRHATRRPL